MRDQVPDGFKIEIETRNLEDVKEALDSGVDTIMLDNMGIEMMTEAVTLVNKKVLVEASGNITLDNVEEVARTGVDFISVGALTHSARAVDVNLTVV